MLRAAHVLLCLCGIALAGCSHMLETRVIQAFADGLKENDIQTVRKTSSTALDNRALSHDESLKVIRDMQLPNGKVKVIKVEEDKEDKENAKIVVVQVGADKPKGDKSPADKTKIRYRLVYDAKRRAWVVDDIISIGQRPGDGSRTVAEQLEVLLTVHQVIDVWSKGDQKAILQTTAPEISRVLAELPPAYLAWLANSMSQELADAVSIRPALTFAEETVQVRVPKPSGELQLRFRRQAGAWKVDEASQLSRRDGNTIASLRQAASALATGLTFERAYIGHDRPRLKQVCAARFFNGSLQAADLDAVPIPISQTDPRNFEVRLEGKQAYLVVQGERETSRIALEQQEATEPDAIPGFKVTDVTLYERHSKQDKRMSAIFTAQAVVRVFGEAMHERDLAGVRASSTGQLAKRVWSRLTPEAFRVLSLPGFPSDQFEVVSLSFAGQLTEITVDHGEGPVTYQIRDQNGRLLVDDVLTPAIDRPQSLKATFEILIPVLDFTSGVSAAAVEPVRANSSREFNRLVWNQVEVIPEAVARLKSYFDMPLKKLIVRGEQATVLLGGEDFGARFLLVRDGDRFVVDDVQLIRGLEESHRDMLRRNLRTRLARGE